MPSLRRASIRELTTAAYELGSGVVQGRLRRASSGSSWTVDGRSLDEWLAGYDGQEIVLIVASLDDARPLETKTCGTCGTEYVGMHCPRCHEARLRLRGR